MDRQKPTGRRVVIAPRYRPRSGPAIAAVPLEFLRDGLLHPRLLPLDRAFPRPVLRGDQRLVIGAILLRLYLVGGIEGEAEIVLRRLALLDPLVKCLFDGFALVEPLAAHLPVFAVRDRAAASSRTATARVPAYRRCGRASGPICARAVRELAACYRQSAPVPARRAQSPAAARAGRARAAPYGRRTALRSAARNAVQLLRSASCRRLRLGSRGMGLVFLR